MDRAASSQGRLHGAWGLPEGGVAVNERVWYRDDGDVRAIFCGMLPLYSYDRSDKVNHKFAAVQLIEAGLARQNDVATAFGLSVSTLCRARRVVAREGIAGLVGKPKGPTGRRTATRGVAHRIAALRKKGPSHQAIADRLAISPSTVNRVLRERGLTRRQAEPTGTLPFDSGEPEDADSEGEPSGVAESLTSDGHAEVEATSSAYASPREPFATRLGLIEEAPVAFAPARDVPLAGVRLGVAWLSTTGLMEEARGVYGRLQNGGYGLRATVWMLFVMALLRVKRPEQLQGVDPAARGHLLGLPRAAEVKTLRRKRRELAERGRAAGFQRRLAQRRARQPPAALAYLYVDGHVRAYRGQRKLGQAYGTSRPAVLRAETDYGVNLSSGQPLLVVQAQANERLTQLRKAVSAEVRTVSGARRALIGFERGGWSPDLFRMRLAEGFDRLTYRQAPLSDWPAERFHKRRLRIDGHSVTYELADGEFQKQGWPGLRGLAVQRPDGPPTPILCSRYDLDPVELAYRMFGRWKPANWFQYRGEQFALDVLVAYASEPDDPDRPVLNPTGRGLDQEWKAARAKRQEAEAAYGRVSRAPGSSAPRERYAAEVEQARDRYERLGRQRRDTPRPVRLGELSDGEPVQLTYERKLLTDTIKMCAYDVETQLTEMLAGVLRRHDFAGRAVIRELFQTPGDRFLSNGQLHVHRNQRRAPRYTKAMMSLCDQLNARQPTVPETTFTLRFHVKPRPENGQK